MLPMPLKILYCRHISLVVKVKFLIKHKYLISEIYGMQRHRNKGKL